MSNNSYVYLISRPNGMPCYVGKGRGRRWLQHARRTHNKHLERIYAKAGGVLPVRKVAQFLSNAEAIELERFLIAEIGREKNGGPLVNLTDGGDGTYGRVVPPEVREKHRLAGLGRTASVETRSLMSAAKKGKTFTPEHAAKIGDAHRGKKSSDATLALLREIHGTKQVREQHRVNALHQHSKMTDEQKIARAQKISEATRLAMKDPAVSAKISSALSGRIHDEARRALTRESLAKARLKNPHKFEKTPAQRAALISMHERNVGRRHSEETKAKMRAAHAHRLSTT